MNYQFQLIHSNSISNQSKININIESLKYNNSIKSIIYLKIFNLINFIPKMKIVQILHIISKSNFKKFISKYIFYYLAFHHQSYKREIIL